jgi:SulP family sulfate permease
VVSLVALPLSMALSIAVGLPPQHGIYTAIAAGIITPLLGGAPLQVSGPTAAFVVILAPIVQQFGLRGIIWCSLMAGGILLFFGFSRLGRLINYMPYPVTTGFTSGIAVVLATLSLNDLLGLGIPALTGDYMEKAGRILSALPAFDPYEALVGGITLALLAYAGRFLRFLPSAIPAMLVGGLLAAFLTAQGQEIDTISSRFSWETEQGETRAGIPSSPPKLHWPGEAHAPLYALPSREEIRNFLFPALVIAVLAALESLLSATVADSMSGTRHDPNAELNAIGIGNILSALCAGIPATGAIARTATLINSGGKTPLSSALHAVLILCYVVALAPVIGHIPMASLAALLVYTAYRMSHYRQFIRVLRIAPRSDSAVLLVCFLLTVFIDMVAGVGVGIVLACFLLVRRVVDMTHVDMEPLQQDASYIMPEGEIIYRVRGPLFFGTIEKAFDRALFHRDALSRIILDFSAVPFIDITGLVAVKSLLASTASAEQPVYLVCPNREIREKIARKISDLPARSFVQFHDTVEAAREDRRRRYRGTAGQMFSELS